MKHAEAQRKKTPNKKKEADGRMQGVIPDSPFSPFSLCAKNDTSRPWVDGHKKGHKVIGRTPSTISSW
jgi:hypothetical protein